jgi:UDP-N-acetylglucosamine 1-carboxyvinyltransferase
MNNIVNQRELQVQPTQKVAIRGGKIRGVVELSAAKNSMLRLLVASILTSGRVELRPFPHSMLDADILRKMLVRMGKTARFEGDALILEEPAGLSSELRWEDRSVRSTVLMAAAMLSRFGKAVVPNPGTVDADGEYLLVDAPNGLVGTDIYLPIRSTGATESGILAGCLAKGTTTIWGPHVRPEILDLIEMLNKMGADIAVYGQERIVINGVKELRGVVHDCVSDNVEALTWVVAAAVTGGDVEIRNFPTTHLEIPLIFLRESGVRLFIEGSTVIVRHSKCFPIDISTGPYPGINSDMQPLFAAFALFAKGESRIIDLRFPGRYAYAGQLALMGAKTAVDGNMLRIFGGEALKGTDVRATDLRAGIALLIAALNAEGTTVIDEAWQIERGYDRIWEKLTSLGIDYEILDPVTPR